MSGNYQSGISVMGFSDPASQRGGDPFVDPAPLSETTLILGGDWSSYRYDGRIYDRQRPQARPSEPPDQEFTIR